MLPVKTLPYVERGLNFCEQFQTVTILFSDIVSYTSMAAQMDPMAVVNMLNELYFMYDRLVEKHNVYKVETIGDAFMCAGGVPDATSAVHGAEAVANMALDMIEVRVAHHYSPCARAGLSSGTFHVSPARSCATQRVRRVGRCNGLCPPVEAKDGRTKSMRHEGVHG